MDIQLSEYDYFSVKKIKKQKSMLSKLNNFGINLNLNIKFGGINKVSNKLNNFFKKKTKSIKYSNYYMILNEFFIYFCKDEIIFTDEKDKRRIGSIVPLTNVKKINVEKEGDLYKLGLEISFRTEDKIKEFFVDDEIYMNFIEQVNIIKKEYNLESIVEIKTIK